MSKNADRSGGGGYFAGRRGGSDGGHNGVKVQTTGRSFCGRKRLSCDWSGGRSVSYHQSSRLELSGSSKVCFKSYLLHRKV